MRYWIGLGSNVGDRLQSLKRAVEGLAGIGTLIARSKVYASSPVGGPPQPPFLNAVVVVDSDLEPPALLGELQRLEAAGGRDRESEVRWGPRTIDLDVLLLGARGEGAVRSPGLEVPHPRLHERLFTLLPLVELEPTLVHPTLGRPLKSLIAAAQGRGNACATIGETL